MVKPMTAIQKPPKARLPRGLADRSAADIRATERMMARIRRVYERYGFEPVETPLIEYTDALGKFLPDQDRPNEGVFSFQDDDEQWLSLRYDLTAPLARYVAENYERLPKPYRSYRAGWVFRNEKPGPGRFRQFMQFDADTVGAVVARRRRRDVHDDGRHAGGARHPARAVRDQGQLAEGARRRDGGDRRQPTRRQKLTVLRAIDKLDRLGIEGVRELLGPGRKDESGDFTKGAGLDPRIRSSCDLIVCTDARGSSGRRLGDDLDSRVENAMRFGSRKVASASSSSMSDDRAARFAAAARLWHATASASTPPSSAASSTTPARSSRPSCSFEVTEREGPAGRASARSAAAGAMTASSAASWSEDVPATGFSIGVSRLQAALPRSARARRDDGAARSSCWSWIRDRIGDYQTMVAELRRADIPAELYLGDAGMQRADEICRPPQRAARHHPGRRREGARRRPDQGPRARQEARRRHRRQRGSGARSGPARKRSPRPIWSRRSTACSAAASGGRDACMRSRRDVPLAPLSPLRERDSGATGPATADQALAHSPRLRRATTHRLRRDARAVATLRCPPPQGEMALHRAIARPQ